MTQLAGLRFYLQQTSDDRQLSFLPPLDYFTGLPHQLPGQRQELVVSVAYGWATDVCWGLRRAADLQQAVLHGSSMIHDFQCAALALRGDAFQAAAEHANAVAQKRAVGWKVHVRFNGSRVGAQFVTFGRTLLASQAHHPLMNFLGDRRPEQGQGSAEGGELRRGL